MQERSLVAAAGERVGTFLDDLARLSALDCGTWQKAGVDAAGQFMRAKLEESGAAVTVHRSETMGDSLVARWRGDGQARVLIVGHLDTVYPPGWAAEHPFHIDGDRAYGPGTADMKAGLLSALHAVGLLRSRGFTHLAELIFVLNSDEEVGSPSSKDLIRSTARGCHACLVLEPGRANGNIVSARKGMVQLDLRVLGISAHAGIEKEKGRSAVLELAHQTIALEALTDLHPGVTVNVGITQGGMARNVVPAEASALVDIRAWKQADLDAVMAAVRALAARTTVPGTTVLLERASATPPLERTAAGERLVRWCQEAARAAGFKVDDTATGGGSDGNTTAAMGIPTIDGLGPVGGRAHSPDEYIEISSIAPRIAMLAGLIERICAGVDDAS